MKLYFEKPTQVAFWDADGDRWVGGIAFEGNVICGCCGGLISLEEIYEFSELNVDPVQPYEDWIDLSMEIMGGMMPSTEQTEVNPS